MKRAELIKSREYWVTKIQIRLFKMINEYMSEKGINRTELSSELKVTKGYVTQIMNGSYDHKISKLVDLALLCNKVPVISFQDLDDYIGDEICGFKYDSMNEFSIANNYDKNDTFNVLPIKNAISIPYDTIKN